MNFSFVLYGPYRLLTTNHSSEVECIEPRSESNEVHKIELTEGTLLPNTATPWLPVDTSVFLPTDRALKAMNYRTVCLPGG